MTERVGILHLVCAAVVVATDRLALSVEQRGLDGSVWHERAGAARVCGYLIVSSLVDALYSIVINLSKIPFCEEKNLKPT